MQIGSKNNVKYLIFPKIGNIIQAENFNPFVIIKTKRISINKIEYLKRIFFIAIIMKRNIT